MEHLESLERLRARQQDFEEFEHRVKGIEARASHDWMSLMMAGAATLLILGMLVWLWWSTRGPKAQEHPLLADIRYHKLPANSATRQRLQRAGELMAEGWQALQSEDPKQAERCLQLFAKAVELDEMACGWKDEYEESLEKIGDLLDPASEGSPDKNQQPPPKSDDEATYNSMLTEAYLVLVLYTVVALFGKASPEVAEDYEVIKTRLDRCVKLQPKNPVPYKLRADWCQRFTAHAERDAIIRDFEKAIVLTETDKDGSHIRTHGVDPQALRSYLLSYCNFQLGSQMQHKKDYDAAFTRYKQVLQHADPDFVHLPETHFNLAILTIMKMREDDNKSAMLAAAVQHYSDGSAAAKRLLKWMPSKSFQASKKMAKELVTKLTKAGFSAQAEKKLA